jgi:hypothetical protein
MRSRSRAEGAVRTSGVFLAELWLVTFLFTDLVTVVDRELLPGLVLTTLLELEELLLGVTNDFDLDDELLDVERTAGVERFVEELLLDDLTVEEELFRGLLLRTEVDLDLLLLDPDLRCASAPKGAIRTAISVIIKNFFMVPDFIYCLTW